MAAVPGETRAPAALRTPSSWPREHSRLPPLGSAPHPGLHRRSGDRKSEVLPSRPGPSVTCCPACVDAPFPCDLLWLCPGSWTTTLSRAPASNGIKSPDQPIGTKPELNPKAQSVSMRAKTAPHRRRHHHGRYRHHHRHYRHRYRHHHRRCQRAAGRTSCCIVTFWRLA